MEAKVGRQGKPRVLVLRPPEASVGSLADFAIVAHIPVIDIEPVPGAGEEVLSRLENCEWLILTSPRAPRIISGIAQRLKELNEIGKLKIAVVGPKTLEELNRIGLKADLVPQDYRGISLAKELAKLKPKCVIAARSEKAVPELVEELRKAGVDVIEIPLYRVVILDDMARIAASIADEFNYVVFTSPSIAEAFTKHYQRRKPRFTPVSIGPTTAKRLVALGFAQTVHPKEYTMDAIAELIRELESKRNKPER